MQRTQLYTGSALVALALFTLTVGNSVAGGQGTAIVRLQAATPGAAQTGNFNVSGTGIAGSLRAAALRLTTGAAAGRYLTSDASGNGAWSDFDLPLPYEDSGVANNTVGLFRIINNGSNYAIEGRNDSGAFGKLGGDSTGAYGEHGSSFNRGSLGNGDSGVSGSNNNNPSYGYLGGPLIAVYGEQGAATGTAMRGRAYGTTGINYGVHGSSASATGYGMYAVNTASSGNATALNVSSVLSLVSIPLTVNGSYIGVEVNTTRSGAVSYGGYYLSSGSGARGVYANASGDGTKYGLRGAASGTGTNYGVYSVDDLGVAGNKQFVIDHPLDPANKYLKHYCSEGPVPMNEYSGTVETDSKGFAWIELPSYYDSINKDPRYLLTVIDDSDDFVLAKVTKEISNRRFQIRTSKPGVKVTWIVKAQRNDAWNIHNPPQVEVEKEGAERGKYQHPEHFGMPASMGMDYREGKGKG